MDLLAFDTSTDQTTIAVQRGDALWQWQGGGGPQASGTLIPKILEGLSALSLTPQALTAIVFGQGPGAFTGLRTACAVAQGLAFGSQVPVLPVCSLLAVAHTAYQAHGCANVLAVLDARMGEVYSAHYHYQRSSGQWQALSGIALSAPGAVQVPSGAVVVGNAQAVYADLAPTRTHHLALPSATALLQLAPALIAAGGLRPASQALPLYIRDKVAQTTAERLAARAAGAAGAAGA